MPGRGGLRGWAGDLIRILIGPWPIYPVAVILVVLFSLLIRSLVRIQSQPVGAAPVGGMIPAVLLVVAVTTVVAGLALCGVPRLVERVAPLRGRPAGRARYVLTLLLICALTALALAAARFGYPDGGPPIQLPPWVVTLNTAIVAVIAVFATNGITGYAVDRLRRQEATIARQLSVVREERLRQLASEERVRAETARFLHDDLQSSLLRASMRLVEIEGGLVADEDRRALRVAIEEIDRVREDGVRGASRRLSPPLESTGLIVALRELADGHAGVMLIEVEVAAPAAERFRIVAPGDRLALAVYRIAEQGVQNALKHGAATRAVVEVSISPSGAARLVVRANGRPPGPRPVPGVGSAIISAWLDDVGGAWSLGAAPGGVGSELVVELGDPGGIRRGPAVEARGLPFTG
jgi:signal transduction histidine kinase